jgi:mRNA-degrading endonuclease RelE of RelBE toxin-antitoxin system
MFQLHLIEKPDAGDIIRGAGGARKIRWGTEARGKRGGVRVIYYWITSDDQILLLTAYAKNEASDLTEVAKKEIKRLIQGLK